MVAFQKERSIKGVDAEAMDDTIQGLLRAGVFTKTTEGHTQFCANLNCVSKPSPSDTDFGKVQTYLNRINQQAVKLTQN